jgi:site-specific DNA recombinase
MERVRLHANDAPRSVNGRWRALFIELFDAHGVAFVSVTQSFNTSSSMGRLTLNVLLSFAQFERELIGERVRDKIAASKRKGLWVGGPVDFSAHRELWI